MGAIIAVAQGGTPLVGRSMGLHCQDGADLSLSGCRPSFLRWGGGHHYWGSVGATTGGAGWALTATWRAFVPEAGQGLSLKKIQTNTILQ